jgi:DNA-binding XRE family transcriptional regulator
MPRPRRERPKLKREEDRAKIAELRKAGVLQGEIAALLGVSRQTVGKEEADLVAQHRARAAKDTQLLIRESLARIEWGQREAAMFWLDCRAGFHGDAMARAQRFAAMAGIDWKALDGETQAALALGIGEQNEIRGVGLALFAKFEQQRRELLGLDGQYQSEETGEKADPKEVVTADDAERLFKRAVGGFKPSRPFGLVKGGRR